MLGDAYDAALQQEKNEYQQYLEAYEAWQEDREFAYGIYADETEREAEMDQASAERALEIWKTYGYATTYVTNILGVPTGTPTSDQSYDNWRIAVKG